MKVSEFTVTVILVLFATCLNATSDVCRTLPALIAVTANCDALLFSSRLSTQQARMTIHKIYTIFRNYGTLRWWRDVREAQPYRAPVLHCYGNLAHAGDGHEAGVCCSNFRQVCYPLSYRVPVRERYGSKLLLATREQHDQNCTQSH